MPNLPSNDEITRFDGTVQYDAVHVRVVLGNKCAGQHYLKTVHFREKLTSGNFLAWLSAVCVFFAVLYLP